MTYLEPYAVYLRNTNGYNLLELVKSIILSLDRVFPAFLQASVLLKLLGLIRAFDVQVSFTQSPRLMLGYAEVLFSLKTTKS